MTVLLTNLAVTQICAGLKAGDFSCREVMQAYLDRITTLEPSIHAFITLDPDHAFQRADESDHIFAAARRTGNSKTPPLLGIPIAVKDLIAVAGMKCTCGSRILKDFVPSYTATAVQRLIDAGAVVIGKTNTDEFAMGSSTETSAYGPTFNPWDLARVPGGSSGGSAAAVAAHMIPAAIGSDTGGSVRQPASFCGLTGIKPTYGRVSRYGLVAYGSSLDSMGVLAHSAEDATLLLGLMSGFDPRDSTSKDISTPMFGLGQSKHLQGLRIGVPREYFIEGLQAEVESRIQTTIADFRQMGAEIIKISLPHTKYALPVYYLIASAEASANLARYDGVRFGLRAPAENLAEMFNATRGAGFGAEVKRRIMLGTYALSAGYYDAYYGQAQKVRTLLRQDFDNAFTQVDVIACPVTPSTAFTLGEHTDDPLAMYLEDVFTLPANLAGIPGIAFPIGFDSNHLPISMQFMAPHFQEAILAKTVSAFQRDSTFHLSSPSL
jgi:aspartyl-tRNA(Asn)/glutamyl-tRNA(Gln) amidotransferase subunit A